MSRSHPAPEPRRRPGFTVAAKRALGALLVAMLVTSRAMAQPVDPAAADTLFRDGRRAADEGDYETACAKFEASLRVDSAPGTLFNLAHCEEQLGRIARAWTHYREVIPQLTNPGDDRRPFAEQRVAALEPRVARLTLRVADRPAAAAPLSVQRNDVVIEPAAFGLALPVDPGSHVITVRAPGHADVKIEITLGEGETLEVAVEPGRALPPSPSAPPLSPLPRPGADRAESSGSWVRPAGWTLVGLGAAGVALGTVAGIVTLRQKSIYDQECSRTFACSQDGLDAAGAGKTWGTVSTVALAAGAAALGGGAVVLVVSPPTPKAGRSRAAGGAVAIRASF